MTDRDRQLAKTFFFWATQGLKREYKHLDTVFVAHTTEAFEFDEEHFFKVQGSGGTVASTGLEKVREIIEERYNPSRYNIYLFYASDGDNYTEDRTHAQKALREIAGLANYSGYLEVSGTGQRPLATETGQLFKEINGDGLPAGSFALTRVEDVWDAIRHFFRHQSQDVEA
jgi:uncharacterized sporulation protein YeaH/YhbH (DUF444 family)